MYPCVLYPQWKSDTYHAFTFPYFLYTAIYTQQNVVLVVCALNHGLCLDVDEYPTVAFVFDCFWQLLIHLFAVVYSLTGCICKRFLLFHVLPRQSFCSTCQQSSEHNVMHILPILQLLQLLYPYISFISFISSTFLSFPILNSNGDPHDAMMRRAHASPGAIWADCFRASMSCTTWRQVRRSHEDPAVNKRLITNNSGEYHG